MRYTETEAALAVGLVDQQENTSAGYVGIETSIGRHIIGNDGRPLPSGVVSLPDRSRAIEWLVAQPTCDRLREALDHYEECENALDVDAALGAADAIIELVRIMLAVPRV